MITFDDGFRTRLIKLFTWRRDVRRFRRFLNQMRAHHEMLEFKIGDRVVFQPPGQGPVEGMLTRYNKKTVTVITNDGRQWNVSPTFLSKAGPSRETKLIDTNVVLLGKC
jgi:hypothetical protein